MLSLIKKKSPIELMSAETFNGEIDLHLGKALTKIGFSKTKQNHWVQDLGTGVRKIVTIMHWKGAESTPRWGYSLDYVPNFDNSCKNIFWHRTNKSAMIDVFPLYFDFFKYSLSRFSSPNDHENFLKAQLPNMLKDMDDFYKIGSDPSNLVNILEKCEAHKTSGPGFWNWTQLPLAYAFTLGKSGNLHKANEMLVAFINRREIAPKAKQKLLDRFNDVLA